MPDRSAGWFRFFCILRMLARNHEVWLHPEDIAWQRERYGTRQVEAYRSELEKAGVRITGGKWSELSGLIRAARVDVVFFEYYRTATRASVDYVRFCRPHARIVVDSIDVVFNRLTSKAMLTKQPDDLAQAQEVKAEELAAYSLADVVVSISDSDRALLEREGKNLRVEVIPLVYPISPLPLKNQSRGGRLLFIADYGHDANVDAIVYFCTSVLPLVARRRPEVEVNIVGHSPPKAVTDLAGRNARVLGYVSDIAAVYASSDIAIAPMRFGGGLKGKVAEAMSYGIPVVATSVSLEGFGVAPGKEALVGDSPEGFADAVVSLMSDGTLYAQIRENGWRYVKSHFSEEVVGPMLDGLLGRIAKIPVKKLPFGKRIGWTARQFAERSLLWRFRADAS